MGTGDAKSGTDWGAVTKWLVIGVVLIVLIFVLKEPLASLVNRTQDFKVTKEGVEIHTTSTAVGDVKYSQETITTNEVAKLEKTGDGTKVFVSSSNYVLTWPQGSWRRDDQALQYFRQNFGAPGYTVDMVCTRLRPSMSGFTPNVNVLIGQVPPNSSITALAQSFSNMYVTQFANARLVAEKVDETTQGAILIFTRFDNLYSQKELYQIQRIVANRGTQYILTATTTTDDDDDTKRELLSILNSFRIVQE